MDSNFFLQAEKHVRGRMLSDIENRLSNACKDVGYVIDISEIYDKKNQIYRVGILLLNKEAKVKYSVAEQSPYSETAKIRGMERIWQYLIQKHPHLYAIDVQEEKRKRGKRPHVLTEVNKHLQTFSFLHRESGARIFISDFVTSCQPIKGDNAHSVRLKFRLDMAFAAPAGVVRIPIIKDNLLKTIENERILLMEREKEKENISPECLKQIDRFLEQYTLNGIDTIYAELLGKPLHTLKLNFGERLESAKERWDRTLRERNGVGGDDKGKGKGKEEDKHQIDQDLYNKAIRLWQKRTIGNIKIPIHAQFGVFELPSSLVIPIDMEYFAECQEEDVGIIPNISHIHNIHQNILHIAMFIINELKYGISSGTIQCKPYRSKNFMGRVKEEDWEPWARNIPEEE